MILHTKSIAISIIDYDIDMISRNKNQDQFDCHQNGFRKKVNKKQSITISCTDDKNDFKEVNKN